MTAPVLFGRAQELLAVERLVARIPEAGGALVLRGDAGIGKTAVLGAARSQAEAAGALVLEAGGVPSEAALAFAGLQQLLRPVAEGVDRLRAPQRAAVSAALGTADAPVADPFLIALATLNLLADAADRTPLLLLVDDAHWLDRATGEVLAFAARRLGSEPIGMLVGLRD